MGALRILNLNGFETGYCKENIFAYSAGNLIYITIYIYIKWKKQKKITNVINSMFINQHYNIHTNTQKKKMKKKERKKGKEIQKVEENCFTLIS